MVAPVEPAAGRRELPVAAVVPCRDSPHVGDVVDALVAGTRVPAQIVVVDDGSRPPVAAHPAAALVRTGGIGRALARNLGAARTREPLLWFVDADVRVAPDTLALLYEEVVTGGADAAMAVYADTWLPGYEGFRLTQHRYHVAQDPRPRHLSAACLLMRRRVFDNLGGFPDLVALEDIALGMLGWRQGCRWHSVPAACVEHVPRGTGAAVLKRDYRERGVAAGRLAARYGLVLDHAGSLRELVGFGSSLAFLAGAALGAGYDRRFLVGAGAAAGLWALCDGPWLRAAWRTRGWRFAATSPAWLLLFRSAVMVGVVHGYLDGAR